jgi:hypothetical protein
MDMGTPFIVGRSDGFIAVDSDGGGVPYRNS